jgi:hypothetical protein
MGQEEEVPHMGGCTPIMGCKIFSIKIYCLRQIENPCGLMVVK